MTASLLPFDKIKATINTTYQTNNGPYEIKELKLLHKLRPFRSLLAMVNPSLSSFLRPDPELEVYIYIRIFYRNPYNLPCLLKKLCNSSKAILNQVIK